LFCSSLTRSQIVAAVTSIVILALVTVVPFLVGNLATVRPIFRKIADQMVYRRYAEFSRGVLDTGNIVFFVLAIVLFLFLTTKVLESRRWK